MNGPARVALAGVLAAAAAAPASAETRFDPLRFFAGRTRAAGTLSDGFGQPAGTFTGRTVGRRQPDGATVFDQAIRMEDGSTRRRSFRLVRTGPYTVDVTGSEVVGTARGTLEQGTLRLVSSIRLVEGNPLSVVRFDQTFRALPGGRAVSNNSDVSVLGIVVRRADEVFTRTGGTR